MLSCLLLSHRNTNESLGELRKAVSRETHLLACVSTTYITRSPKLLLVIIINM